MRARYTQTDHSAEEDLDGELAALLEAQDSIVERHSEREEELLMMEQAEEEQQP